MSSLGPEAIADVRDRLSFAIDLKAICSGLLELTGSWAISQQASTQSCRDKFFSP
ncbi:hypothetical protein [Microseira sp. BLCC-F43]|uniref:hypothetical protein n=1 Tax=Microseira sp. BLCC-F43 TaxID=3153602 RepID=UPI0035B9CE33